MANFSGKRFKFQDSILDVQILVRQLLILSVVANIFIVFLTGDGFSAIIRVKLISLVRRIQLRQPVECETETKVKSKSPHQNY